MPTRNSDKSRAARPRTRIEIGHSGLVYAIVGVLILAAAVGTQNNLLFWAFGLLVGGVLASLLVVWRALSGLAVQRLLPQHAVVGEPLVIRYHVLNTRLWLPLFNVVIGETWGRGRRGWRHSGPVAEHPQRLLGPPRGWILHVGPRQTVQAQAVCWPQRRGPVEFERIVVSTTFPFGLIRRTLHVPQTGQVLVYPRLYRMRQQLWYRLAAMDPGAHLQIARSGGTEEFFGLRRYRAGDSLRMIDWKHTARTGELISREMTQPSPPRVMLVLDLRSCVSWPRPRRRAARWWWPFGGGAESEAQQEQARIEQRAEQAISLAASVICGAHLHGYQVGMQVLGATAPFFRTHHSLPHRTRMLETLARLAPHGDGAGTPGRTVDPNVLVTADPDAGVWRRCLVLAADDLHQHVQEVEGGSDRLLARGVLPRTKRPAGRLTDAWT